MENSGANLVDITSASTKETQEGVQGLMAVEEVQNVDQSDSQRKERFKLKQMARRKIEVSHIKGGVKRKFNEKENIEPHKRICLEEIQNTREEVEGTGRQTVGFIYETKNQPCCVENKLRACGFGGWFLGNPNGTAGGLALAWKEGTEVIVTNSSDFFIAAKIKDVTKQEEWGLIGVHFSSIEQIRHKQFEQIKPVLQQFQGKTIILGDFNAIKNTQEKEGGCLTSEPSMTAFNSFIDDNSFLDLGMVGRPFTWSNRRRGQELIQERLDRVLATLEWCESYPTATVFRLQEDSSDHAPLLLDSNPPMEKTKCRFKFQEKWCWNAEVRGIVEEMWKVEVEGSPMFILAQKLKKCRHSLVRWQQTSQSNSLQQIRELKDRLEELRSSGIQGGEQVLEIEKQLEVAYLNEESYWKDKSRIKWPKTGDRNTKFFHQFARVSCRSNKIWSLVGENGVVATTNEGIAKVVKDYFKSIFSASAIQDLRQEFEEFVPKVTPSINRKLLRPVSMEEVKRAAFSVHPQSAPGDDGFTAKFFHTFWSIVGRDVFSAMKSFFSGGRLLRSFNHTHICLIPKVPGAKDMSQEIHGILARFWWGQKGEEWRISWVSWDMMTRPKLEGGLGFKNLKAQNLALLGKQCWRIATQPNSILARILKGKYFRYTDIMRAEVGNLPSWDWRSILEGRKVTEKGLIWQIGPTSEVNIFSDPWIPPQQQFTPPVRSPYRGITAGEEENMFFKCWEAKKKYLILNSTEEQDLASLGIYCWCIWRSRNDHVFGQVAKTLQEVDGLARRMIS
ncbi:uncharacterized protein [Arachis hypogaea]|uniref:uncharacterized protein n=1 Tax=Arachis hypogaea TaxID=3818 RepID=UPI003B20B875